MASGSHRLGTGGRIDRSRAIAFTLEGRRLQGFGGDTLAAALLAEGVSLLGRSFKYHRPRGLLAAGVEEPNGLVTLGKGGGRTPNVPATTVELHEGIVACRQNGWPSVEVDVMAALTACATPLLGAGFYYKTFMGPRRGSWMLYEPYIRRAAGLGQGTHAPDPDRYETRHAFTDVLVIGAGPAGLAAAAAASAHRQRVILCDEQAEPGGSLLSRPGSRIDGQTASDWVASATTGRMTVLTRIHHRQTPLLLMQGLGQAGVTWRSEAIFQERQGHPGGKNRFTHQIPPLVEFVAI